MKTLIVLLISAASGVAFAAGTAKHEPLFPPKVADKTLATRPANPQLLEPSFEAKISGTSATLKWDPASGATSYRIQVASDVNFKWLITEVLSQEGTTYELTNLEAGKHYYWRVAGVKRDNDAGYTQSFFNWSSFVAQ